MIALENGLAQAFESLSLLDARIVLAHNSITSGYLLLTLSDSLRVPLESLTHRVLHYFIELVGECVKALLSLA
jgi:hypothetical protein